MDKKNELSHNCAIKSRETILNELKLQERVKKQSNLKRKVLKELETVKN